MGIYGNKFNTSINEDSTLSIDISSIDTFCENTSILFDAFYNFFSITEAENITVYKSSENNNSSEKEDDEEKKEERQDIIDGESKLAEIKKTFWTKIKELISKIGNWFKELFTKLANAIHSIYLKLNINDAIFKKFKEKCSWDKVEAALRDGRLYRDALEKMQFIANDIDIEDSNLFKSYSDYYYGSNTILGDTDFMNSITRDKSFKFNFVIDAKRDIEPILNMDDEKAEDFYKDFEDKLAEFKKEQTNYFNSIQAAGKGNNLKPGFAVEFRGNDFYSEDGKFNPNYIPQFKDIYLLTLKMATEGDSEIKKYKDHSKDFIKKFKLDESNFKSLFKESKSNKESSKAIILYNKMNWEFTATYIKALMTTFTTLIAYKRVQHEMAVKTILKISKYVR